MNPKKICSLCALFLCANMTAQETSNEEIFTNIYTHAVWGTGEEGEGYSGGGSTLETTVAYRIFLENFLVSHNIKSVADVGCGYWEFSKAVNWENIDYTGYDIVPFVIDSNKEKYEAPNIRFVHADVLSSEIPEVDLVICKDLFAHLSNEEIKKALIQFPKCKYCLIINDIDPVTLTSNNSDIECGSYRPVDLAQAPFSLQGTKVFRYWANNYLKQVFLIEQETNV